MNKYILSVAVLFIAVGLVAQEEEPAPTNGWKFGGLYNVAVTQTSLTNWAAGGNNNVNINGLVKQLAIHTQDKWVWNNLLEANFGYNLQPGRDIKTDDKLEFSSRLDRQLHSENWNASLFVNFRTQFADGYKEPEDTVRISTWLAPAYLTYGLGVTNKSVSGLTVYLSPITVKQTFVVDSALSANDQFYTRDQTANVADLANGGSYRTELGAYMDIIYTKAFSESFELNSKLNLFSNYLDRPQNIDVNWETILLLKVYSYLSVSLQLHLIYDHDVNVRYANDVETADGVFNAPGTQFKQILGVGLAYSFGEYKK